MSAATSSFCGDKFVFKHTEGLLVCEKQVQERTYPIFAQNPYNNSLSEFFAGSLTGACVSQFGVHITPIALPVNLVACFYMESVFFTLIHSKIFSACAVLVAPSA
jgi:hypothetical protein